MTWPKTIRVRPEPQTSGEIRAEIAFLEEQLNGRLDEAIEHRIAVLREKLAALGREAGS